MTRSDVDPASLHEIDAWMLGQLNGVIRDVRAAYERFEFYRVYQRIYQFCAVELSSFYLDVLKDRLYAEAPAGPDRRAAQFVLARLHDNLTRLLAPIIPHTAEESWDYRPRGQSDKAASVHLAEFPETDPRWDDDRARRPLGRAARACASKSWSRSKACERTKQIGSAQEARVRITTNRPEHWLPDRGTAGDALHRFGGRDRRRPGGRDRACRRPSDRPMPSASDAGTIGRPSARAPSTRRSASDACGWSAN